MSKKWITFLVAAVVGALVFVPTVAMATCQVSIVGQLSVRDKSNAGATVSDPAPTTPGHATSAVNDKVGGVTPAAASAALINGEGQAERLADLLVYDSTGIAGATFCFNAGNIITITFNGVLSNPAVGTALNQVANMDVYDSNGIGGLSISSAVVSQAFAANTTQTLITITVGASGTAGAAAFYPTALGADSAGSALRVKNLRMDATSVNGNTGTTVNVNAAQGPNAINVFIGQSGAGPNVVGTKTQTIASTTQPSTPNGAGAFPTPRAVGVQSSASGLRAGKQATPQGEQLVAWTPSFLAAFRLSGGTCNDSTTLANDTCVSGIANDIATGATSLAWSISGIPSGVTVTFPSKIDTTAAGGTSIFKATSAALSNNGVATTSTAPLAVIYSTTAQGANAVTVETADNVDTGTAIGGTAATNTNPNCTTDSNGNYPANLNSGSVCDANPKIGVTIGAQSQSGTATLNLAFGPADTALFTGDDAATTGLIPRYTGKSTPTGVQASPSVNTASAATLFTRYIVKAQSFFVITPTRSTLLFPFVSTVGGWNTGIQIINACADSLGTTANSVFGSKTNSCTQTGGVTFFFFGVDPTNANAPVQASINTDLTNGGTSVSSACRGFNTNGQVVPGSDIGCNLTAMLPLLTGAPKGFDGYVIAVTGFNGGHGFSAVFGNGGAPWGAVQAMVLPDGGRGFLPESLGN